MKSRLFIGIASVAAFAASGMAPARADDARQALEARGRALAVAGDCVACHTAPGGVPYAGGRPIETPFGVIYSRNLTPDRQTGLGAWSDQDFYRALHEGRSRDGAHLYPAFPYTYFTGISPEDSRAIKAFLATLEPVTAVIPENKLPWPLSVRGVMAFWNLLFFREGAAGASSATAPGRGAYLVEVLGHCGACHTPKNFLGADKTSAALQGGEIQNWLAPNDTGDLRAGLGAWSETEIVEYLRTGRNARALAGGPMAEVVEASTSRLTEEDRLAIARYLKRLPPAGRDASPTQVDPRVMNAGEAIFVDGCAGCHQVSGEGSPRAFVPLKGSAVVQSQSPLNVIHLILAGARAAATDARPTPFTMPAYAWKLDDDEVAAVASYVRNAWGNAASPVTPAQVRSLRKRLGPELSPDGS